MKDKNFVILGTILVILAYTLHLLNFNPLITTGSMLLGVSLILTIAMIGRIDKAIITLILLNTLTVATVKTYEYLMKTLIIETHLLTSLLALNIILAMVSGKPKRRKKQILPQPAPKKTEPEKKEEYFFSSPNGNSFHRRDCMTIRKIERENLIVLKSRSEALEKGYKPCRVCRS